MKHGCSATVWLENKNRKMGKYFKAKKHGKTMLFVFHKADQIDTLGSLTLSRYDTPASAVRFFATASE